MPKQIITVNRQYGSGGREVGELVAKQLGYAYYDKELIKEIADTGDIDVDFVNAGGEGLMGKLSAALAHMGGENRDEGSLPLPDRMFLAQGRTVRKVADEGPCVIIGHLSDYFLADRADVLDVFIYSDFDARVARVARRNGLDTEKAKSRIKKVDRNRASFYECYTDLKWGKATNYDLSLSTTTFSIEEAARIIAHAAQMDADHD
jgi:cytidylate kinase